MQSRFLLCLEACAVILSSVVAWSGVSLWLLPVSLVFPLALGFARSRRESFLLAACYFGAALWPCIGGAAVFFGRSSYLGGAILWLAGTVALSLPFALIWMQRRPWRWLCIVAALCVEALLPIGMASPLTSAGVLFPGTGFTGIAILLLLCLLCALPVSRHWLLALAVVAVLSGARNWMYEPELPFMGWRAVNTHLGGGDPTLQRVLSVSEQISDSPANVLLLPENAIPGYTDTLTGQWLDIRPDETVLIGTTLNRPGTGEMENVLLGRGAQQVEYRQRIPVPIAMWGKEYPANFTAPGSIRIQGKRAAVLICYEQLLVLPVLSSFWDRPDILLAASNLYWAHGTNIGDVESMCVQTWARLFAVPYLEAVNE